MKTLPFPLMMLLSPLATTSRTLQSFNVLSYISSHDTRLFFEHDAGQPIRLQLRATNLLLLAPGAVQIYYGDESGRPFGPSGSDPLQGTRSDMNWNELQGNKAALLQHWQKLGAIRQLALACSNPSCRQTTTLSAASMRMTG